MEGISVPIAYEYPPGAVAQLMERIRLRRAVPFLGAGVSAPTIPTWKALLLDVWRVKFGGGGKSEEETRKEFDEACDKLDDLERVTEVILEKCVPGEFARIVKHLFSLYARRSVLCALLERDPKAKRARARYAGHRATLDRLKEEQAAALGREDVEEAERLGLQMEEEERGMGDAASEAKAVREQLREHVMAMKDGEAMRSLASKTGALRLHTQLITGPYPLLLTTNWDAFCEAAYEMMREDADVPDIETYGPDISMPHPHEQEEEDEEEQDSAGRAERAKRRAGLRQYYHRTGRQVPVYYRHLVPELFAALRGGRAMPRLFKIHGDLTPTGQKEFVSSHSDFRRLVTRDVACMHLMRYLSANYSYIFAGCSLSDSDLLGTIDDTVEAFSSVGPHFWITNGEDTPDLKAQFLLKNYSVMTIAVEGGPGKFLRVAQFLGEISRKGWRPHRALRFRSVRTDLIDPVYRKGDRSEAVVATELQRCSREGFPNGVLEQVCNDARPTVHEYVAVGIPVPYCPAETNFRSDGLGSSWMVAQRREEHEGALQTFLASAIHDPDFPRMSWGTVIERASQEGTMRDLPSVLGVHIIGSPIPEGAGFIPGMAFWRARAIPNDLVHSRFFRGGKLTPDESHGRIRFFALNFHDDVVRVQHPCHGPSSKGAEIRGDATSAASASSLIASPIYSPTTSGYRTISFDRIVLESTKMYSKANDGLSPKKRARSRAAAPWAGEELSFGSDHHGSSSTSIRRRKARSFRKLLDAEAMETAALEDGKQEDDVKRASPSPPPPEIEPAGAPPGGAGAPRNADDTAESMAARKLRIIDQRRRNRGLQRASSDGSGVDAGGGGGGGGDEGDGGDGDAAISGEGGESEGGDDGVKPTNLRSATVPVPVSRTSSAPLRAKNSSGKARRATGVPVSSSHAWDGSAPASPTEHRVAAGGEIAKARGADEAAAALFGLSAPPDTIVSESSEEEEEDSDEEDSALLALRRQSRASPAEAGVSTVEGDTGGATPEAPARTTSLPAGDKKSEPLASSTFGPTTSAPPSADAPASSLSSSSSSSSFEVRAVPHGSGLHISAPDASEAVVEAAARAEAAAVAAAAAAAEEEEEEEEGEGVAPEHLFSLLESDLTARMRRGVFEATRHLLVAAVADALGLGTTSFDGCGKVSRETFWRRLRRWERRVCRRFDRDVTSHCAAERAAFDGRSMAEGPHGEGAAEAKRALARAAAMANAADAGDGAAGGGGGDGSANPKTEDDEIADAEDADTDEEEQLNPPHPGGGDGAPREGGGDDSSEDGEVDEEEKQLQQALRLSMLQAQGGGDEDMDDDLRLALELSRNMDPFGAAADAASGASAAPPAPQPAAAPDVTAAAAPEPPSSSTPSAAPTPSPSPTPSTSSGREGGIVEVGGDDEIDERDPSAKEKRRLRMQALQRGEKKEEDGGVDDGSVVADHHVEFEDSDSDAYMSDDESHLDNPLALTPLSPRVLHLVRGKVGKRGKHRKVLSRADAATAAVAASTPAHTRDDDEDEDDDDHVAAAMHSWPEKVGPSCPEELNRLAPKPLPTKSDLHRIRIYLPTLGMEIGQLDHIEALRAMLSAIGDFASEFHRRTRAKIELLIVIVVQEPMLMAEVAAGRIGIGSILSAAHDGWMTVAVAGASGTGSAPRHLRVPLRSGTFADMARSGGRSMHVPDKVDPNEVVHCHGVTDGAHIVWGTALGFMARPDLPWARQAAVDSS